MGGSRILGFRTSGASQNGGPPRLVPHEESPTHEVCMGVSGAL